MNRPLLIVLLAGPALFAADPLPSAESVLDRYVQVTGGKQAYDKRKTEIAHGTLEYTSLGIKGTITRYAADPDKYYASLDIEGLGKVEMGVNGQVAWENSALLGPRLKSGVERAEAIREGSMNSTVNWRKLYPKVETVGTETVNPAALHTPTPYLSRDRLPYFCSRWQRPNRLRGVRARAGI